MRRNRKRLKEVIKTGLGIIDQPISIFYHKTMEEQAKELFRGLDITINPYLLSEDVKQIERRRKELSNPFKRTIDKSSGLIILASSSYGKERNFFKSIMRYASEVGIKTILMIRLSVDDLYADYTLIDPTILTKRGMKIIKYFKKFKEPPNIHITSDSGTDISFKIDPEREWGIDNGIASLEQFSQLPGGEVYTCPIEETVTGVAVMKRKREIYLIELENGVVIDYSKSYGKRFDEHPELLYISEWGWGTNPEVEVTGKGAIDEKQEGTTHFGFGDNYGLGKRPRVDQHFDLVEYTPVIKVNGNVILRNKKLYI